MLSISSSFWIILLIAGDENDEIKPQILTDWTVLLGGAHK